MQDEKGTRYALLAYGAWGLFPLYWKLLAHVPAIEILYNRVFWSWVFYTVLITFQKQRFTWKISIPRPQLKIISIASVLLTVNWFIYIWAVNAGHIVETSLGYFINPLVSVGLGVWIQKETLNRDKKISIAIAALGVAILTYEAGRLPWIALSLAVSFGLYGLLKKRANISGVESGQFESLIMILPVLGIVFFTQGPMVGLEPSPMSTFNTVALLIFSGIVTGLPLVWFTEAARRLPLNILGLFQYLAPTLQFLTGVFIFHEAVSDLKWVGFFFIWMALAFISIQSLRKSRRRIT